MLGKIDADFVPYPTAKLSGKESLAETWILHKMNACAKTMNEAINAREFMKSTSSIYSYCYDELFDVFIGTLVLMSAILSQILTVCPRKLEGHHSRRRCR